MEIFLRAARLTIGMIHYSTAIKLKQLSALKGMDPLEYWIEKKAEKLDIPQEELRDQITVVNDSITGKVNKINIGMVVSDPSSSFLEEFDRKVKSYDAIVITGTEVEARGMRKKVLTVEIQGINYLS